MVRPVPTSLLHTKEWSQTVCCVALGVYFTSLQSEQKNIFINTLIIYQRIIHSLT
jgi:hypothetical protein